jgi:hypothetical protein
VHPLAHHAGEQALAPLLLLGSGGASLLVAIGRAQLAAARARLTGKDGPDGEAEGQAREPTDAQAGVAVASSP